MSLDSFQLYAEVGADCPLKRITHYLRFLFGASDSRSPAKPDSALTFDPKEISCSSDLKRIPAVPGSTERALLCLSKVSNQAAPLNCLYAIRKTYVSRKLIDRDGKREW